LRRAGRARAYGKICRGSGRLVTSSEKAPSRSIERTVIAPASGWPRLGLRELYGARAIVFFLALREIKARYKQTAMGVVWAFLQPILPAIVFSIFMGRLAGLSSDGVPYPVFVFVALLPWQLYARSLGDGAVSLLAYQQLVTKVYVPRLVLPSMTVLVACFDLCVASLAIPLVLARYGIRPGTALVALPGFIALLVVASLGSAVWLAALTARFRDVRNIVPFVVQLGAYATPVVYSTSLVPTSWRLAYAVNPLVTVIDGFRWTLASGPAPSSSMAAVSAATAIVLLVSGLAFFNRVDRTLADMI
jgi:lipopolysaccharide transport system permease protein